MIEFAGSQFLLDIEGTTSSISFVYDVMFPFARRELAPYLQSHWGEPELDEACELIARDVGFDSFADWRESAPQTEPADLVQAEIDRLMDGDIKATGLKQLQGLIWKSGFASGEMQAHLYDDVPPALEAWREAGRGICIYSSGSVGAQKLFFGHTLFGDLLSHFDAHFDTTTGPKREAASYTKIATARGQSPGEFLFLSDVVAELDAAQAAGMQTALLTRPGNPAVEGEHSHGVVSEFGAIRLV